MKTKRLTIMLLVFLLIVLIVVLSSTVFALKNVSLSFLQIPTTYTISDANVIVKSVDFKYGTSVFLIDKKKYMNKLEKANAKIKVIGIETRFPDGLMIQVVERYEFCALQRIKANDEVEYLICDSELKVLRIVNNMEGIFLPHVLGLDIDLSNLAVGDFCPKNVNTHIFSSLESSFYNCYYEREQVINLIQQIAFNSDHSLILNSYNNFRFKIIAPQNNLDKKIYAGLKTIYGDNGVGEDFIGLIQVVEKDNKFYADAIPNG